MEEGIGSHAPWHVSLWTCYFPSCFEHLWAPNNLLFAVKTHHFASCATSHRCSCRSTTTIYIWSHLQTSCSDSPLLLTYKKENTRTRECQNDLKFGKEKKIGKWTDTLTHDHVTYCKLQSRLTASAGSSTSSVLFSLSLSPISQHFIRLHIDFIHKWKTVHEIQNTLSRPSTYCGAQASLL